MENKNQSSKDDAQHPDKTAGEQGHAVHFQKEKMSHAYEEAKKVVKPEAHPRQKTEGKFRNRPLL